MLYKTCNKCKRKLKINEKCKYCLKEKNKIYDSFKRNSESRAFYNSNEWKITRDFIMNKYNYLDLYALKVLNKIIKADVVHHIVEYREDKTKALDEFNLIPLSHTTHNLIHTLYNRSEETKKDIIKLLKSLL